MKDKVFVVIVNFNSGHLLERALKSVYALRTEHLDVVVVDNASRDGSLEQCRDKFSRTHVIYNTHNIGFGAGANAGIRFALEHDATHVLLLNPDATIAPDALGYLCAAMRENKKIGIASPVIFSGASRKVWFSGGKISFSRFRATHDDHCYRPGMTDVYQTEFITGCSLFAKKELFRDVGLFDERYFLYYEDADLSLRARNKGYTCAIVPQAQAWHDEVSETENKQKVYWLVLSGLLFFQAHTPLYLSPWFYMHRFLRRVRNAYRVRIAPNGTVQMVARAYDDYYAKKNNPSEKD